METYLIKKERVEGVCCGTAPERYTIQLADYARDYDETTDMMVHTQAYGYPLTEKAILWWSTSEGVVSVFGGEGGELVRKRS